MDSSPPKKRLKIYKFAQHCQLPQLFDTFSLLLCLPKCCISLLHIEIIWNDRSSLTSQVVAAKKTSNISLKLQQYGTNGHTISVALVAWDRLRAAFRLFVFFPPQLATRKLSGRSGHVIVAERRAMPR